MEYTQRHLFRDLLKYFWPDRRRFLLGTVIRAISDVVWLFPPFALGEFINIATDYEPGMSLQHFWVLTILVWGAALIHYVGHDVAKFLVYQSSEHARLRVIRETIAHLFKLDADWHEKENSGNKLQRIHKGGDSLDEMGRLFVDLFIQSSIDIIGVTLVLATLGWQTCAIMLVFFVTYYALSRVFTKRASRESLATNVEWENFEGVLFESVNNVSTIKALGLGKSIMNWLETGLQRLYKQIKRRIFWYRARSGALNLYRELLRQILLVTVIFQVFAGNLEVGIIATVMLYFHRVSESAEQMAELSYRFELGRIALMRLDGILSTKPTAEDSGTKPFPKNWKRMELADLRFAYQDREVLSGLSFALKRGEKLGIVGLSGAGKSTLFKLMLKLYDRYEGSIRFDDRELKDIRRSSYLEHFSYVPQETELFNLSLKDNVTLAMDGKVDEQRLKRALQVAHVKDFLHKLPEGVESLIGEKGVKLSGGEKQRVGIARAIYRMPELLFLDEATSHLDAESEEKIQTALHDFLSEVTAVVIAHRLSTLKEMDRIVVLDQGRLIEEGNFEELIQKRGVFYKLWKRQAL